MSTGDATPGLFSAKRTWISLDSPTLNFEKSSTHTITVTSDSRVYDIGLELRKPSARRKCRFTQGVFGMKMGRYNINLRVFLLALPFHEEPSGCFLRRVRVHDKRCAIADHDANIRHTGNIAVGDHIDVLGYFDSCVFLDQVWVVVAVAA